jgi:hypothetical protein
VPKIYLPELCIASTYAPGSTRPHSIVDTGPLQILCRRPESTQIPSTLPDSTLCQRPNKTGDPNDSAAQYTNRYARGQCRATETLSLSTNSSLGANSRTTAYIRYGEDRKGQEEHVRLEKEIVEPHERRRIASRQDAPHSDEPHLYPNGIPGHSLPGSMRQFMEIDRNMRNEAVN